MTDQTSFQFCERMQGERLFHTVPAAAFESAHKLDSNELQDGVTKYLAINALRVVELYRVPAAAMERFSADAQLCGIFGVPL